MAALPYQSRASARRRSPQQLSRRRRHHQGLAGAGQSHGEYRPAFGRRVQTARRFPAERCIVRLQDVADVVLGAEDYDTQVRLTGSTAVFMGIFHCRTRTRSTWCNGSHRTRRDQERHATGLEAGIGYDASEYISKAIHDVTETLIDTLLIVSW